MYGRNKGFLGATSTSARLEERPLLSETEARLMDPDEVIILASDGVWEFISSEEALAVVHRHRDNATIACEALIAEATEKWRQVSHSATSTGGHRLTSVASST